MKEGVWTTILLNYIFDIEVCVGAIWPKSEQITKQVFSDSLSEKYIVYATAMIPIIKP